MATPPKITVVELSSAIRMIAGRRTKVEDPHRHLLPDNPEEPQVRDVLDYLAAHSPPTLPRWVLRADVHNALTLNVWLWWEDRRRERTWLRRGVQERMFLSELGAHYGIGRQGVRDRIDRLDALLLHDRPNEQFTRAARRAQRQRDLYADVEHAWITAHYDDLTAVQRELSAAADRYALDDEDREWIDELATDWREDKFTPASMAVLSLAVTELRTHPAVTELDSTRPHKVHQWCERADTLRADFASIGARSRNGVT